MGSSRDHRPGRPGLHATLLAGLRDLVGADHVTDLSYDRAGGLGQCSAASLLNQSMIEWTTNLYVNGSFYRRDPTTRCSAAWRDSGAVRKT